MKYAYPAVFTFDESENCYYVNFPDMENCFTDGKNIPEAIENAEDVLSLMLCQMEDDGAEIPSAVRMRLCRWFLPIRRNTEGYMTTGPLKKRFLFRTGLM